MALKPNSPTTQQGSLGFGTADLKFLLMGQKLLI